MAVLIGGSGSTGSSLLRTILNRHPLIFSGSELNFFNKKQLYYNWNKYKTRVLTKNNFYCLYTTGWFPYKSTALLAEDYYWT